MSNQQTKGEDARPPQAKRPRLGGSEEDLVVVVGGQEFRESSHHLRCVSDYFEKAFVNNMTEAQKMRFEFPDKDPKEWELVKEILLPFPRQKITEENILIVMPWLDYLSVTRGFEECDRVLSEAANNKKILAIEIPLHYTEQEWEKKRKSAGKILDYLQLAVEYPLALKNSLEILKEAVSQISLDCPRAWQVQHMEVISSLILSDTSCRNSWADNYTFKDFLFPEGPYPENYGEDLLALAQSGLFPRMTRAGILAQRRRDNLLAHSALVIREIKTFDENCSVRNLKGYLEDCPVTRNFYLSNGEDSG